MRDEDVVISETVARLLSEEEVEHNCRYTISDTPPSWCKSSERELPPLQFSISDGSKFVVVSLIGVHSTERLRELLDHFDIDDAYQKLTEGGPGVLRLNEIVYREEIKRVQI